MQKSVEPGSNIVYTDFVKIKKRLLLSSAGQAAPGSRFLGEIAPPDGTFSRLRRQNK